MRWLANLLLAIMLAGPALAEDHMPKKTILKSTQPSEENWKPSFGQKVLSSLRDKSAIKGFTIKVEPTRTDSFNIGAMKSKRPSTDRNSDSGGKGQYFVGLRYTKRF